MSYISTFTYEFNHYGFTPWLNPCRSSLGFSYVGSISTKKYKKLEFEFYFADRELVSLPKAYLINPFDSKIKPFSFPHLNGDWELCFDDGSFIFDKYKPDIMVPFCIQSLTDLLDNTNSNDLDEIYSEFRSYWESGSLFLGKSNKSLTKIQLTDELKRISNKEYFEESDFKNDIPIFKMEQLFPLNNTNWPISNFISIQNWLSTSIHLKKQINHFIKNEISKYNKYIYIVFHEEKYDLLFGIILKVNNSLMNKRHKNYLQGKTIDLLFRKSIIIEKRFWIDVYTSSKILESNTKNTKSLSLTNKKILLVGLGTIGSNLVNILVKSGAGDGTFGSLTIIDNDLYYPYNFSRHFLGLDSSYSNKCDEIKKHISKMAPFVKIISVNESIFNYPIEKNNFDIVIDTTGEESLTIWLNEKIDKINRNKAFPIIFISGWIKGSGEYAECFIRPSISDSCHECYRSSNLNIPPRQDNLPLRDSCRSIYVPFPITASLYSSLLFMYVIEKYLSGEIESSMFYRQNIETVSKIIENQLPKIKDCPICSKNSMTV